MLCPWEIHLTLNCFLWGRERLAWQHTPISGWMGEWKASVKLCWGTMTVQEKHYKSAVHLRLNMLNGGEDSQGLIWSASFQWKPHSHHCSVPSHSCGLVLQTVKVSPLCGSHEFQQITSRLIPLHYKSSAADKQFPTSISFLRNNHIQPGAEVVQNCRCQVQRSLMSNVTTPSR